MRVLVTGSDGYIGSVLVPRLISDGHDVTGLDACYYADRRLYPATVEVKTIRADLRRITREQIEEIAPDAIVHLAELSNDPLGQHNPDLTHQINHKGTIRLAEFAKSLGVKRFVYTSSCSVYGAAGADGPKTESSSINPQTAYADCKTLVERDLPPLADDTFTPIFLRNATVFGKSPNMRFDLVLNNLAGLAWTTGVLQMHGDGSAWRPLVHVADVAKAISEVLTAPKEKVHNQIFNVGGDQNNYTVKEIALIIQQAFHEAGREVAVAFGDAGADNRSYRVNFDKIKRELGFDCDWDAAKGAAELVSLFEEIGMTSEDFEHRNFTRLKQLQYLIETGAVDGDLYGRAA